MADQRFRIHGDNIVECTRIINYISEAFAADGAFIGSLGGSITCPEYVLTFPEGEEWSFTCLPGYGERRWPQDIIRYVREQGGTLREAADAVITRVTLDGEAPLFAVEFCGALPAGNQAWQRQGRAFSFAHAKIPYFYVAELGGFELGADRTLKAQRLPNPAVPFSFLTITAATGTTCLPVYEMNSGATLESAERYESIFGKADLLAFIAAALRGEPTEDPVEELRQKCLRLVALLSDAKRRQDGLTGEQWAKAYSDTAGGLPLTDYLKRDALLPWSKVAYIADLTDTARRFMDLGALHSYGLASKSLPLSFVPSERRPAFAKETLALYPNLTPEAGVWLAKDKRDLAIAWVMGFKPKGDDARPDRGLPPLARMLVGDQTDLLTFVYGPAPQSHWRQLDAKPELLAAKNGLWEAVLGVSDAILVDSATQDAGSRSHLRNHWAAAVELHPFQLNIPPRVLRAAENDVDTALHLVFRRIGSELAFEGMCNPPGGDWSGVSFMWSDQGEEYRWLTLPRVTARDAKRPDHVFALFSPQLGPICLCVESKERARSLEAGIGPRLTRYAQALFATGPSVVKRTLGSAWEPHTAPWVARPVTYASMGAFVGGSEPAWADAVEAGNLDIACGFEFVDQAQRAICHLKIFTPVGKVIAAILANSSEAEGQYIEFVEINS